MGSKLIAVWKKRGNGVRNTELVILRLIPNLFILPYRNPAHKIDLKFFSYTR